MVGDEAESALGGNSPHNWCVRDLVTVTAPLIPLSRLKLPIKPRVMLREIKGCLPSLLQLSLGLFLLNNETSRPVNVWDLTTRFHNRRGQCVLTTSAYSSIRHWICAMDATDNCIWISPRSLVMQNTGPSEA